MLDSDPRVPVAALQRFGTAAMQAIGCDTAIAAEISDHLVDADLCGVYSHGIFRLDWYAEHLLKADSTRRPSRSCGKPKAAAR